MVNTPNNIATHVENESITKEDAINAAMDRFDLSENDPEDVSVTAGGTITLTDTQIKENWIIRLTGSPAGAFNLDIPDGDRKLALENVSGQTATVDTVTGGSSFTLLNGESVLIAVRGTAISVVGSKGISGAPSGAGVLFGRKSEFMPASAMQPSVTKPCSDLQVIEGTASNPNIHVRFFDSGAAVTLEEAQFQFPIPNRWDKGTLVFEVFDTHAGGQTGGQDGRVWGLSAVAISHDEAWNTAFGTEVLVTIDEANANRVHKSAESAALTVAGSPSDDDFIFFRIRRKTDDAADDMDIDVGLLGVRIYWTEDAGIDD